MQGNIAVKCLWLLSCGSVAAYKPPRKFIIVSNAMNGTITYGVLPTSGSVKKMYTLVSPEDGLVHPQGLAVDQKRRLLLVADSGLRKIVSYGLSNNDNALSVDEQTPVVEDVESRWVAADGSGNVFFSDEIGNRIMKVSAKAAEDGNTTGTALFTHANVSAPGGVASDNFFVYWTNKVDGDKIGTVGKAFQDGAPDTNGVPQGFERLASNTPKAYGVCLAVGQVFFTDPISTLWGVNKSGVGQPVAINRNLSYPRGCAWDGSRVLVADRGIGAVFAVPAPMATLAETSVERVADVDEAFGIAVYSAAARLKTRVGVMLLCVVSLFTPWARIAGFI